VSHPTLDSFGDLDEAARDAHVAGCEQCQAELRGQQQVRELLASLPDPGPVPPDVIDRIEATLRELGASPTAAATATVVPLQSAPSARRRRPLFAVAAAAVLLAGGGFAVSRLVPQTSGADNSAAGATALRDEGSRAVAPERSDLHAIASGTDYTRQRLAAEVDRVLGSSRTAGSAAPSGPLATPAGVASCLSAIGAPQATPLLVDVARFEHRPAAVVVLPADDGGREIWVVSTTCRPGQDGTQYFTRLR
jgi:hypothetical protein